MTENEKTVNQKKNPEKQSRGERKTIKALEVFCFSKVNTISKVKIEKKNQIWLIDGPEIYQSQNYNSLLIFGDAKIGKEI